MSMISSPCDLWYLTCCCYWHKLCRISACSPSTARRSRCYRRWRRRHEQLWSRELIQLAEVVAVEVVWQSQTSVLVPDEDRSTLSLKGIVLFRKERPWPATEKVVSMTIDWRSESS